MRRTIVLDDGHGGADPGAIGRLNGVPVPEKKFNYNVTAKVKELLEKSGFLVYLTRKADEAISIADRCKMANQYKADLLVSIHHNAGGGDGFEVIHAITGGDSKRLANLVAAEFTKLGQNKHGVYSKALPKDPSRDYYGIIRGARMPAIIVEFAYIDSPDIAAVDTLAEQWAEAAAIAKAICSFYNVQYKG